MIFPAMEDPLDDELPPEPDEGGWRAPAVCPRCFQNKTEFAGMNYEVSVYRCLVCRVEFEAEE